MKISPAYLKPIGLLFLAMIPMLSSAEIYYWKDEAGKKHFSDRKQDEAVILSIKTAPRYYQIKKIIDGDTIHLEGGVKVRLLGINTPEVGRGDKIAEAGGEEAKQWLIKQLANTKLKLRYDVEKKDHYDRTLAYVFTDKKININVALVEKGWASVTIYPPNLNYVDALVAAQQHAESKKLGIWGMPAYQPKQVKDFDSSQHKGWQRIQGKVTRLKQARKYNYLYLSPHFALKIARDSDVFEDLNTYVGKTIEARGWVRKNKKDYRLLIRHPSAIKLNP
ncbi:MAG: thermonuclease family protein [Methylococcales bacterium]|nr:thermonuclease family protein [Methylococcales bacterium]